MAFAVCLGLTVASCSSGSTTSTQDTTTTAAIADPTKAPVEFAKFPVAPIRTTSTPEDKCFGVKAFRYLSAMPDSGRYFKDGLADDPKDADRRLQKLGLELEAAMPDIAADLTSIALDSHNRLILPSPPSGASTLGSEPDKRLLTYLTGQCPSP